MLKILERLRAATGPDRAIDFDIARSVGGTVMHKSEADEPAEEITLFRYTEDLHDAVSLIPEGMFWLLGFGKTRPDEPPGGCQIFQPSDDLNPLGEGEGPTVALAVCIAALDARMTAASGCNHPPYEIHQPGCDCALCRSADAAEAASSIQH